MALWSRQFFKQASEKQTSSRERCARTSAKESNSQSERLRLRSVILLFLRGAYSLGRRYVYVGMHWFLRVGHIWYWGWGNFKRIYRI